MHKYFYACSDSLNRPIGSWYEIEEAKTDEDAIHYVNMLINEELDDMDPEFDYTPHYIIKKDNSEELLYSSAESKMPIPFHRYVNVYSVTRHYGGPEEGGWWFDAGEPIESRLTPIEDCEKELIRLYELYHQYEPENKASRFSMRGGEDIEIMVQRQQAEQYPKRRPHYE